tara:strand:+ start:11339 stop:13036 length:1698 start_codon:yes stop_codon:yes gene_type:complete
MTPNLPNHQDNDTMNSTLEIIPLGGLGQFGMNMLVVRFEHTTLMIDAGSMFPDSEDFGVERIIPNFEYLTKDISIIDALILTHGHEDHIGAVPYLWNTFNFPVYGTPFTLSLLKEKLLDHNLDATPRCSAVNCGDTLTVGQFKVEFISVAHSIPGSLAIAIKSPYGTIFHTGDFKIEKNIPTGQQINLGRLREIGKQNVLALLSDSTNVSTDTDGLTEKDVMETLERLLQKATKLVAVAIFSSSIHRIQSLTTLAQTTHRKIVFLGQRLKRNVEIAEELGLLAISKDLQINEEHLRDYPPEQILCVTTGSQGEPFSALSRIARGDHKNVTLSSGDVVIFSSRVIPGNELKISRLIDQITQRGIEIIDISDEEVHASGHATATDLKVIINTLKPQYFIPIHGNYRKLTQHAHLAEKEMPTHSSVLMVKNGTRVCFDHKRNVTQNTIPAGLLFIDKTRHIHRSPDIIKIRRELAKSGIVIISVAVNRAKNSLVSPPSVKAIGLIDNKISNDLIKHIPTMIEKIYRNQHLESDTDYESLEGQIKLEVRRVFKKRLGSRPLIMPIVMEV